MHLKVWGKDVYILFQCGTGTFTIELAKLVQDVDAIDCSEKMLKVAEQKADSENISNINWQCSDILDVLKSKKKYNLITAFNILVYLPEPAKVLSNIYDMLDEGGYFLSVTDCPGESNVLLKGAEVLLGRMGIIPKMNLFTTSELEKLIKDAGFDVEYAENFHDGEPNYYIVGRK